MSISYKYFVTDKLIDFWKQDGQYLSSLFNEGVSALFFYFSFSFLVFGFFLLK